MLRCSPGADSAKMIRGLRFNPDGTLQSWNLFGCNLTALPGQFGTVRATGDLHLSANLLTTLPESFGAIRVGDLMLEGNQLTSLPESFGAITVRGSLHLWHNHLTCLPESFSDITVGGSLLLDSNSLAYLPENFGDISVGGDLRLLCGGNDIGPAHTEASRLLYPNVDGEVRK
eukprot:TRINITY_DN2091_c0_g1_i11.p2 TRINITY_DN2091_c0_g1~~TRINITY_DN2091_c0_g1_i11.p2  ORF type:complete len:173 (+),score=28.55 TRINITY_DN2091_c0_g1_i11:329-847(+)